MIGDTGHPYVSIYVYCGRQIIRLGKDPWKKHRRKIKSVGRKFPS